MSRVQLALNVSNLEQSIAFYGRLFDVEPTKVRDGYANFSIDDPPLKLVLMKGVGAGGSLNHLGIEMSSTAEVDAEQARLDQEGAKSTDERGTTCCYAVQDKFWVDGSPDGERWEVYTVLADADSAGSTDKDCRCCGAGTR